MSEHIQEILSSRISEPEHAMRSELDHEGLFDLAANIKQHGLINPITVRPKDGLYEVVAGHRRFSACKINGMTMIPCVVRELTDKEAFGVMTAENLERADVDAVDEAIHLSRHMQITGQTVEEIAKSIRRSVKYVETRLAVGEMPDYMKEHIKRGELKLGAALALFQIDDDVIRRVWVGMAVRDGVSVPQAEHWLHGYKISKIPGVDNNGLPPTDFVQDAAQPITMVCAIDGKRYDAALFKSVVIYKENVHMFDAIVAELRKNPPVI